MMLQSTTLNNLRILRILCLAECLVFLTLPALAQQDSDQSAPGGLIAGPKVTATTAPPPTAKPTPNSDVNPTRPDNTPTDKSKKSQKTNRKMRRRSSWVHCGEKCEVVNVRCGAPAAAVAHMGMGRCTLFLSPEPAAMLNNLMRASKLLSGEPTTLHPPDICGSTLHVHDIVSSMSAEMLEQLLRANSDNIDERACKIRDRDGCTKEKAIGKILEYLEAWSTLKDELYHLTDDRPCDLSLPCAEFRSGRENLRGFKALKPIIKKMMKEFPEYKERLRYHYCDLLAFRSLAVDIEKCICKTKNLTYASCGACVAFTKARPSSKFCEGVDAGDVNGAVRKSYLEVPPAGSHDCLSYVGREDCTINFCGERGGGAFRGCMEDPKRRDEIYGCVSSFLSKYYERH